MYDNLYIYVYICVITSGIPWVPDGGAPTAAAAPAPVAPAAAVYAPPAASPAAAAGTSKVKNDNPDDFATYLAKRKAAEAGTNKKYRRQVRTRCTGKEASNRLIEYVFMHNTRTYVHIVYNVYIL